MDEKSFYDGIGNWDFSRIKYTSENFTNWDYIEEIKKNINSDSVVLDLGSADVVDKMHWSESPLEPYFDDVIFSCDVGFLKPDRKIYELSLEHLGVKGKEAVFVGDGGSREHTGAKAIGMKTVCVRHLMKWPNNEYKQIRKNVDLTLNCFSDLLRSLP